MEKREQEKEFNATTDAAKGALKKLATEEGYETFVIPDNVGGRFFLLTAGFFQLQQLESQLDDLMAGAREAENDYKAEFKENDCYKYAAMRNLLYRNGKAVEMLINYEPKVTLYSRVVETTLWRIRRKRRKKDYSLLLLI